MCKDIVLVSMADSKISPSHEPSFVASRAPPPELGLSRQQVPQPEPQQLGIPGLDSRFPKWGLQQRALQFCGIHGALYFGAPFAADPLFCEPWIDLGLCEKINELHVLYRISCKTKKISNQSVILLHAPQHQLNMRHDAAEG